MGDTIVIKFSAKDDFTRIAKKLDKSLGKNRRSFKQLDAAMGKSARKSTRASNTMSKAFGKIGKAFAGMAIAAVAAKVGMAGVKNVLTLEQQIARSLQNVRGTEEREMMRGKIRDTIISESDRSGKSREEVGEALFNQLSLQGSDDPIQALKNFVTNVTLATASTANLGATVEGVSKLQSNFASDLSAETGAEQIGAALFAAQQIGATDVQRLVEAMPGISATLSKSGVNPFESIALLATASVKLKNTDTAATALEDIYGTLFDTRALTSPDTFGMATSLDLPTGDEILDIEPTELLKAVGAAFKDNPAFFKKIFSTAPDNKLAPLINDEFIATYNKAQSNIATDIANPEQGAVAVNFKEATSGILGADIQQKALKNKTLDAAGEALAPAMVSLTTAVVELTGRIGDINELEPGSEKTGAIMDLGKEWLAQLMFPMATALARSERDPLNITLDARANATAGTGSMVLTP